MKHRIQRICFFLLLLVVTNKIFGQLILNISSTNISHNYTQGSMIYPGSSTFWIYDGSITVTASGGTAPYSYSMLRWSIRDTNNNGYFPNLSPGNYNINISDANGIKKDTIISLVKLVNFPEVTMSKYLQPSGCASTDGMFTITGSGGVPPYTYSIDGGVTFVTNNTFTHLSHGYYEFILKDANGLLAIMSTINVFSQVAYCKLMISAALDTNSCQNSGRLIAKSYYGFNSPNTPPVKFSLDSITFYDGIKSPVLNSQVSYLFNNLAPGLYHVYATNDVGSAATFSLCVPKYCPMILSFINVDASCQHGGGAINVTVTNGEPPLAYSMDGNNFQTSNIFTGLAEGSYCISVKDATGMINFSTAVVYNNCPAVSSTKKDDTCGNKEAIIFSSGNRGTRPYRFSIDGINFKSDSVFKGLSAGNYIVILKDANGLTDTSAITVNNYCLKVAVTSINETCGIKNGSITASGSGGNEPYQYSIDGIHFQSNTIFNGLDSGRYLVSVKDASFLTNNTDISISHEDGPILTIATLGSCDGKSGTITVNNTQGNSPFQYSIDTINYQSSNMFTGDTAGIYIVEMKDVNGCMARDTVQVTKYPTPILFLGNDTTLCVGQTLLLKAPAGGQYQYQWQDNTTGTDYTAINTGNYWLKVTNQYSCTAIDTISIRYKTLTVFSLGRDTVLCNGQKLNVRVASSLMTSYLWNTGATTSSIAISLPGLYWLNVSDSSCAKSDSIQVDFKPVPSIALGSDTTLCIGENIILNADNTNSNLNYLWQDSSVQSFYKVNRQGTYSVRATLSGCDTFGTINIYYVTKPYINLGSDISLCMLDQLLLNAAFPKSTFQWQDGSNQPTFQVIKPGNYSVLVTNSCGSVTDSINVQYQNCACKFYVPSAFTPNGDGKNDLFKPSYKCFYSRYHLKVFNRWGQVVFNAQNPDTGWDGTVSSFQQPIGVYIWYMEYFDTLLGEMVRKNGTLVLIR